MKNTIENLVENRIEFKFKKSSDTNNVLLVSKNNKLYSFSHNIIRNEINYCFNSGSIQIQSETQLTNFIKSL